jgi:hypothetical protein
VALGEGATFASPRRIFLALRGQGIAGETSK